MGLQVVGARFEDRLVIRAGAALEAALGRVVPRPRIHADATENAMENATEVVNP